MFDIRLMTMEDYDGVYELWVDAGMGLNTTDDSREGIEKYLHRNPATSFVAVEDGRIIGAVLAGHDGRRGYIQHMTVKPEYRKKGIGARLVSHTMDALEKEGIKKVALVAFKKNDLGNGFWERIGFTVRDDLYYRNKSIQELEYHSSPYRK